MSSPDSFPLPPALTEIFADIVAQPRDQWPIQMILPPALTIRALTRYLLAAAGCTHDPIDAWLGRYQPMTSLKGASILGESIALGGPRPAGDVDVIAACCDLAARTSNPTITASRYFLLNAGEDIRTTNTRYLPERAAIELLLGRAIATENAGKHGERLRQVQDHINKNSPPTSRVGGAN